MDISYIYIVKQARIVSTSDGRAERVVTQLISDLNRRDRYEVRYVPQAYNKEARLLAIHKEGALEEEACKRFSSVSHIQTTLNCSSQDLSGAQ